MLTDRLLSSRIDQAIQLTATKNHETNLIRNSVNQLSATFANDLREPEIDDGCHVIQTHKSIQVTKHFARAYLGKCLERKKVIIQSHSRWL